MTSRWLAGLLVAAAVHGGVLGLLSAPRPAKAPATSMPISVVEKTAEEPPPQPPPSPPPEAPTPAAPAAARAPTIAAIVPVTVVPAPAPSPATEAPPEITQEIPAGTDYDAQQLFSSIGASDAPGPPATAPRVLGDYAHPRVAYPEAAVDALAAGDVSLALTIDEHGAVTNVEVTRRAGFGFDELATQLASAYRFEPARDAQGRAVASKVTWDTTFTKWRPADVGKPGQTQGGLVPGSVAGLPASMPSRAAIAARPIAGMSEEERHQICRWQIALRGGPHPDKCPVVASRQDEISDFMTAARSGEHPALPITDRTGHMETTAVGAYGTVYGQDVMQVVVPEAECVDETHKMNACDATIGEYVACMQALATHPCAWNRVPECVALTNRCH